MVKQIKINTNIDYLKILIKLIILITTCVIDKVKQCELESFLYFSQQKTKPVLVPLKRGWL